VVSAYASITGFTVLFVLGVSIAVAPSTVDLRFDVGGRPARGVLPRLLGAAMATVAVVLMSGWLLPGVVVGAGVFWVAGGWQGRRRAARREIERLDALASWIESVRDVLMAGEQPIGAITSSVAACSPAIRPQVRRLALGLSRRDPEHVFRRFADELDDPVGDLVATGLSIAVRRGARTAPVLTALAEQARQQVDRRRLVEAERAPTRREVQALMLIMGGLVLGLLLLGRSEYLTAYDRPAGQIFLAVALAGYSALILRVQRLAAFPRPGRFLTAGNGDPRDTGVIAR
jgi:hypothetical protein